MNPAIYIPIIVMWIVIFVVLKSSKDAVAKRIIKKRKTEEKTEMKELAKSFINKDCLVYTFNSNQLEGTIKEVTDGAILIEKSGTAEAVNLDFVVRIREFPKNKKGKKKSVVLD